MPRSRGSVELLAPVEDVWTYLAEPYHLSDWWPGIATVGLASARSAGTVKRGARRKARLANRRS